MSVERRIAWRFMLRGTDKASFSPMTLFAWLAIGVGVAAMGSLLSVMYGFEGALRDRVLKAYPHVLVRPKANAQTLTQYPAWTEKLKALKQAKRVVPYLEGEMILQAERRTLGVVVWGMEAPDLNGLKPDIAEGELPNPKSEIPEIIMGRELATRLGVNVGEQVRLISPTERGGALGLTPRLDWFKISGLYASGHYEFDQQYAFLDLADAQDLMKKPGAISGWHLWAPELEDSVALQSQASAVLPDTLEAVDWSVFNAALFHSLKLEQYSMFTILSFAILIAVLNIVITLMMHVTHKRKNIGILRALGASRARVKKVFVWQGLCLGGVGLALGAVLTVAFILYAKYFSSFQLPEIYYDRSIPVEVRPMSFVVIYLGAIVFIYLATLFPADRAARLDPIEAIRE